MARIVLRPTGSALPLPASGQVVVAIVMLGFAAPLERDGDLRRLRKDELLPLFRRGKAKRAVGIS